MRFSAFMTLAGLAVAAAGCQKSHATVVQPVSVQGSVTLDGKPLDGAEVTFTTPLMATFTALTAPDGSYQLSTTSGGAYACTGACKVTVSKFVMPPGKTAEPNLSPQLQGAQQIVPFRYCDPAQTTLMVTVPDQGGRFDFPLTSG
jgi:hypothetical protein